MVMKLGQPGLDSAETGTVDSSAGNVTKDSYNKERSKGERGYASRGQPTVTNGVRSERSSDNVRQDRVTYGKRPIVATALAPSLRARS